MYLGYVSRASCALIEDKIGKQGLCHVCVKQLKQLLQPSICFSRGLPFCILFASNDILGCRSRGSVHLKALQSFQALTLTTLSNSQQAIFCCKESWSLHKLNEQTNKRTNNERNWTNWTKEFHLSSHFDQLEQVEFQTPGSSECQSVLPFALLSSFTNKSL